MDTKTNSKQLSRAKVKKVRIWRGAKDGWAECWAECWSGN